MRLKEGKEKFIQTWGTLGSNWGISSTMAQIHALLLISPEAISAETIMEELTISRGSANLNVRALMDWGLVFRVIKAGERSQYFQAEKDIYKVFRQVVSERRRRELEPVFKVLNEVKEVEGDQNSPDIRAFTETIEGISQFAERTDKVLETISKAEEVWYLSALMKLLR